MKNLKKLELCKRLFNYDRSQQGCFKLNDVELSFIFANVNLKKWIFVRQNLNAIIYDKKTKKMKNEDIKNK